MTWQMDVAGLVGLQSDINKKMHHPSFPPPNNYFNPNKFFYNFNTKPVNLPFLLRFFAKSFSFVRNH